MRIETDKKIVSKNLLQLISKSGKTRKEICAEMGIGYSTFTEWANGRKYPRPEGIELLANYFGIDKSDLIEERNLPTPVSPEEVSRILQNALDKNNLTPDAVDALAEVEPGTTAAILAGEYPHVDDATAIGKKLDIPESLLMGFREEAYAVQWQRFRRKVAEERPNYYPTDEEITAIIDYIHFLISKRKK